MNAPHARVRPPGKRIALMLAVLVHLLLAAFLIYGVRWQTRENNVVEVELVRQTPAPEPAPKEEPKPEPELKLKPEPKIEPKPLPPPPKPDIAIKAKEKPKPPPKKEEPKPVFDPFKQQLAQEEKQRALANQIADEERKFKQQREAQAATQAASTRSKALAAYTDRIRAKIRGNIVPPPDLRGNPSAVFEVVQLPSGEVIPPPRLLKSSGHAGYDAAVERAILKSSPLPKPDDPSLFERNLRLTFCPVEDGKCG